MKSQRVWVRAAVVVAAVAALGACTDNARKVSRARVVVEASSAEPLTLIVSTDFAMILNVGDGTSTPFLNNTDSLPVSDGYDESYFLDRADPRIFVQLKNETENDEAVRLMVYLDSEAAYDVSATMANGAYLQYIYNFNTLGVSGH